MNFVSSARPVFIGVSLKMYFGHEQTMQWSRSVADIARRHPAITEGLAELVVLPSFPALAPAAELLAGTSVRLGAQDLFWEDAGAFTGEVSGPYLDQIGCDFVEIGHAERRRILGEGDEVIAAKLAAALRNGLTPIVCVGETERGEALDAAAVCIAQLEAALEGTQHDGARIVAAYEPEWAIGADEPAPIEHIAAVCEAIKQWLSDHDALADSQAIYGGSAGPGLLSRLGRSVDGLFLGRFAHDTASLSGILDEVVRLGVTAEISGSRHNRDS